MRTPPGVPLLLAAAALVAAAGPGGAAPVPRHLMKSPVLDGRWEVQTYRVGNTPQPLRPGAEAIEIAAGTLTWVLNVGQANEVRIAGALAHDPAARHLLVTGRSSSPGAGFPDVGLGYALDGGTLTIAYRGTPDGRFVTDDARNPGDGAHVYVLTRAKK